MADFDRPLAPFAVAYGTEGYFLDLAISTVRSWPKRSVTMLDASEGLDEQELINILQTPDYENRARTVIIEDAHKFKESKEKLLREFAKTKHPTDPSVVLLAVVRAEKLPEIWKTVLARLPDHSRRDILKEYPKLKTYSTNNEVLEFIREQAKRLKLKMAPEVDEWFYKLTGGELHRVMNELRKLRNFLGDGDQTVTMKHLSLVTAHSYNVEPYMIVEAAFKKDVRTAMNELSRLYKSTSDDPAVSMANSLMRQLQKVIVARALLDKGGSADDVATAIEMHPWACKKFFIPMVQKHDLTTLASHMSRLCKLELDVKGSSRSKRTLVELAVLSIAG